MPERLLLTLIGSVLVGLGLEIPISRGALDPPAPVRHLTHCGSFNGGRAHPFRGHAALACSGRDGRDGRDHVLRFRPHRSHSCI